MCECVCACLCFFVCADKVQTSIYSQAGKQFNTNDLTVIDKNTDTNIFTCQAYKYKYVDM